MLAKLQNAIVLIPENLIELCDSYPKNIYIVVDDVLNAMMDVQDAYYGDQFIIPQEGISATATIGTTAKIGNHIYIGENVHIGENVTVQDGAKIMHNCCVFRNVVVGKRTYIYPNVCIYNNCQLGDDCIIHAGVCIGVDGFRFEQDIKRKRVRKMLHIGSVLIGDRVEIGANSAIARAAFEGDATVIADDVKIDNLVHVAHNVKIGARSIIVAQSCIGGSAKIGEDAWIGIGAAISNGVSVGDRAKVLLNAVVAHDVPDDEIVSGFYAMPHKQWKRVYQKLISEGVSKKQK
jgi:UDP-3-O-[3-hydroxymyristoyl] glucosamine N-acyltransferase